MAPESYQGRGLGGGRDSFYPTSVLPLSLPARQGPGLAAKQRGGSDSKDYLDATSRRQVAAANILRLQALEHVLQAFAAREIPVVLLKGAAHLLTLYDHPGDRPMTDVDIWLPFHSLAQADETLCAMGYSPIPECPGEYQAAGDHTRIDVHDNIWFLPPGEAAEVFSRTRSIRCGAAPSYALSPEDHFLYIVAHGFIHHGQWEEKWTADLGLLVQQSALNPDVFWTRAHRWGLAEALEELALSQPALEAAVSRPWRRVSRPRQALFHAVSCQPLSGKGHILQWILLPSWTARGRHLWRALFPGQLFLKRRYNHSSIFLVTITRPINLAIRLSALFMNLLRLMTQKQK